MMNKSVLFCLACRYLYYCKNISYIPDSEYDSCEIWAKTQEGGDILNDVSSDKESDYSQEVINFANKLLNDQTKK